MRQVIRGSGLIAVALSLASGVPAWGGWREVTPATPSQPIARSYAAMAFDSARNKATLFGGHRHDATNGSEWYGDTWEWDGSSWARTATTGPSVRAWVGMAFDSARGKTILFGGSTGVHGSYYNDTWEWDGVSWKQVATSGPGAREQAAMAYDSARDRAVLFGGYGGAAGGYYGDTWEWDAVSWKRVSTAGPSKRYGAAMAYDSARGKTVLFGGYYYGGGFGDRIYYGDTWEWDGVSWQRRATSGPGARAAVAMAYDSARGKTVLFGGYGGSGGYFGDTWEWDGVSWEQVAATGPGARRGAAMACNGAGARIVLFGGDGGATLYSDTWEYAPSDAAPFTPSDVAMALRAAAGIQSLTAPQLSRLDVVSEESSFERVDMADAVKIGRIVSGAE